MCSIQHPKHIHSWSCRWFYQFHQDMCCLESRPIILQKSRTRLYSPSSQNGNNVCLARGQSPKRSELLLSTPVYKSRALWRKNRPRLAIRLQLNVTWQHRHSVHMTYGTNIFCRGISAASANDICPHMFLHSLSTWSKPSHTASRSNLWHFLICSLKVWADGSQLISCPVLSHLNSKLLI